MRWVSVCVLVVMLAVGGCGRGGEEPSVTVVWPRTGTEMPVDAEVVLEFDRDMDQGSVEVELVIEPTVEVDVGWESSRHFLIRPRDVWPTGETITIVIGKGAVDAQGRQLGTALSFSFPVCAGDLQVTRITPGDGTTAVAVDAVVEIEFDHELAADLDHGIFVVTPHTDGELEIDGSVVRWRPVGLIPSTVYTVSVRPGRSGLRSVKGRILPEDVKFSFRTVDRSYLIEVGVDGKSRLLEEVDEYVVDVSVSPSSDRFGFLGMRMDELVGRWSADLFIIDRQGVRRIAEDVFLQTNSVRQMWAGDGRSVVVAQGWTPDREEGIVVYDLDTGQERVVVESLGLNLKVASPNWSPGGDQLAYRTYGDWRSRIFIRDDAGDREIASFTVTETEYGFKALNWSPDGKYVSVDEEAGDLGMGVWLIEADGSGQPRLLTPGHSHVWSPQGDRIALVNINEGIQIHCVATGHSELFTVEGEVGWGPLWSSCGRYLAFSVSYEQRQVLWFIHVEAGSVHGTDIVCYGGSWYPTQPRLILSVNQFNSTP